MPELISPEVECLKLKQALNENHRLAWKSAADSIQRAVLAGETLVKWKKLLPHGQFEPFTKQHFDGSLRTARSYMQAAKGLSALPKSAGSAVLATENSMEGLLKRLKKDDSRAVDGGPSPNRTRGNPALSAESQDACSDDSISEKGRPGGESKPSSSNSTPVSSAPEPGEAADSSGEDERTDSQGSGSEPVKEIDPRPPRSGTEKLGTGYVGKCPNCAGSKWTAEGNCAKCNQPFGEPVGDRSEDEDPAGILRSKGVKTAEALLRVFDDLNHLVPKAGAHKQAIELCKSLLKSAKFWK